MYLPFQKVHASSCFLNATFPASSHSSLWFFPLIPSFQLPWDIRDFWQFLPVLCMCTYLSPGSAEKQIHRVFVSQFRLLLILFMIYRRREWKCWLLQPFSHWKSTLFITEQFSMYRCEDPIVKESRVLGFWKKLNLLEYNKYYLE